MIRQITLAGLVAAAALSGCSKENPDTSAEFNEAVEQSQQAADASGEAVAAAATDTGNAIGAAGAVAVGTVANAGEAVAEGARNAAANAEQAADEARCARRATQARSQTERPATQIARMSLGRDCQ